MITFSSSVGIARTLGSDFFDMLRDTTMPDTREHNSPVVRPQHPAAEEIATRLLARPNPPTVDEIATEYFKADRKPTLHEVVDFVRAGVRPDLTPVEESRIAARRAGCTHSLVQEVRRRNGALKL